MAEGDQLNAKSPGANGAVTGTADWLAGGLTGAGRKRCPRGVWDGEKKKKPLFSKVGGSSAFFPSENTFGQICFDTTRVGRHTKEAALLVRHRVIH